MHDLPCPGCAAPIERLSGVYTRNALAEQLARDLWAARGKTTRREDLASTFIKGDYLRTARRLIPFAGIGSELYVSVKLGRRAIGIELKPSYWRTAVDNLTELESQLAVPSLFDEAVTND